MQKKWNHPNMSTVLIVLSKVKALKVEYQQRYTDIS